MVQYRRPQVKHSTKGSTVSSPRRTEVGGLCPVRRVPRWCHSAGIATKGSVTRKGPAWPQAVGNPLSGQANQRQRWSVGSACRTCRRVAHHAATSFRCKNTHNVPRERPKRWLGTSRGMQVLCTTGHPKKSSSRSLGTVQHELFLGPHNRLEAHTACCPVGRSEVSRVAPF